VTKDREKRRQDIYRNESRRARPAEKSMRMNDSTHNEPTGRRYKDRSKYDGKGGKKGE
jgi:hypothetical protein